MSDTTSAEMFASGVDWLTEHRRRYLTSRGADGHIMDLRFSGGRRFSPHLLLRHTGRKSGKTYISPLYYGTIGGEVVIIASKGGADHNPHWYGNLVSRPDAEFQIGGQAFRGTWREPEGAEREDIWQFMVRNNSAFAGYQSTTDRKIPIVMLQAVDDIPVFSEADLD